MLMIGVQGQCPDEAATGRDGPWADGFVQPTVTEQRTHFGLWCTLSAPLTLSMDFQNKSATDSVWHIVSNTHAIAVNQAWAGHPGTTFELGNSSTGMITLEGKEGSTTVPQQQAWYKPRPGGGAAVFVANHGNSPAAVTIDFSKVPGLGPPAPPAHCDAKAFVSLGDTQCMGLQGPAVANGVMVNSSEACCAACSAAGESCETWGFCAQGEKCARANPVNPPGSPGCFLGKSSTCVKRTDGWVAGKRSGSPPPPPPPPPPSPPKMYSVTDVWSQSVLAGTHSSHTVSALGSHDSIFLTLAPA